MVVLQAIETQQVLPSAHNLLNRKRFCKYLICKRFYCRSQPIEITAVFAQAQAEISHNHNPKTKTLDLFLQARVISLESHRRFVSLCGFIFIQKLIQ